MHCPYILLLTPRCINSCFCNNANLLTGWQVKVYLSGCFPCSSHKNLVMSIYVPFSAQWGEEMEWSARMWKQCKKTNARTQYLPPRLSSACPHKALGLILHVSKLCLRKTFIPDVESMINLLKVRSFFSSLLPRLCILKYLGTFFFFLILGNWI